MIEKNAISGIKPVCLTMIHSLPESVSLGHSIRAARMKRRRQSLRRLGGSKHFRTSGLIKTNLMPGAFLIISDSFQQTQCTQTGNIGRILRLFKRYPDMRLRPKVIYFIRLNLLQYTPQSGGITQIAVVQLYLVYLLMQILMEVIYTRCIQE